jgi:hypothetical protein
VAIAVVLFLCAGIPARAALTKEQQKCQGTVAKKGRVFFKKRLKALSSCHDAILAGKLPDTTDCELESLTMSKIGKAEQTLRDKITADCADTLVGTMDFGRACLGVSTAAALADCVVAGHEDETDALIDLIYSPATKGTCSGGVNMGDPCSLDADCPSADCEFSAEQRDCTKSLAKILNKLASKRQSILQKCKKSVGKGKLPAGTDCVAASQTALDAELNKARTAVANACPATATAALEFGGACAQVSDQSSVVACSTCAADRAADGLILVQHGTPATGGAALVKQITNPATECVGGRMSRCRANDYLLANDRIRVVVQDIQRNLFGIGQYGGQIIDGDLVRGSGPDRDNFEEWSISLNIESTAHYTSLTILNDGSNGGPAVLRATGVDDLIDFVNPSSVVASFNFLLPPSADDFDIPVTVTTDYILDPGANYVRVETTVHNTSASGIDIFFGEYIGGSGQLEMFQTSYGFGEPLVTTRCPADQPNYCNYTAWSGVGDADGVSYGYMHEVPGSTTFTTSGVHVPQLNTDVLLALAGLAGPPFHIGPNGDPDDDITFTRYFIIGDGTAASIEDTRNEIACVPTGRLEGTVTAGGNPVARAGVAVMAAAPGPSGLSKNVFIHSRTDDDGKYAVTLPPGNYTVAASVPGTPYEGNSPTPVEHAVTISAFGLATQDIALPATGALQVTVVDEDGDPSPAKVSVVGFDPSPPYVVTQNLFGLINNRTGMFGDLEDPYPFGMTKVAWAGVDGDTGVLPIEPGNYQVYVSRGTEFSLDSVPVTVTAGATTPVSAQVERVIDSTGFVSADFHVHSIDSPDAAVTNVQRVSAMLGEGVEFFATTDHDFRSNFQPTIDALGASDLVGTITGEEITTFDYGHFNAWPVVQDSSQVNNGAVDFGGAAPDGQDYPSAGSYNLSPEEIIDAGHADAPGSSNTVQINHIHSMFGLDGGSGLAIDTGLTPPQSVVPAAARRLNPVNPNFFLANGGAGPDAIGFDALEIWIGDDRDQVYNKFRGQNAGDWFNLINQGIVRTGVADSDTHNQFVNVSGFPHNMVAMPTDDPGDLSEDADTISANVNAGRSFGTNGPMVRVSATAASTGQTAALELGYPLTISTTDGAVTIDVDIQSPTWAEFDTVEYYINPVTTRSTVNKQSGAGTVSVKRYAITPTTTQSVSPVPVPVPGTSSSRLEASTSLSLTGLTQDIWVVVMVKGTDGVSRPLYPVIGNSLKTSTNTTLAQLTDGNLGEDGVTALAFTNPLFIDVDGGGWTPPGVLVAP